MDVQNAWNRGDEILEQCLTAMHEKGLTVEECLALHPEQRADLEPLLILAVRLRAGAALQAPTGLKTAAIERLRHSRAGMLTAESLKRPELKSESGKRDSARRKIWTRLPRVQGSWWRGWVGIAAALVILVLLGVGTATAAARSLPGDLLYPIKLVQEDVQLSLARDDASRAGLRLEYAERRMVEAEQVIREDRTAALEQTLTSYSIQIERELAYLEQESSQLTPAQRLELATKVLAQVDQHEKSLAAIASTASPALKKRVENAQQLTMRVKNQATKIIHNPTDGSSQPPVPPTPLATQPANQTATSPLPTKVPSTLTQQPSPGNLATALPTSLPSSTFLATRNAPTGGTGSTSTANPGAPTSGIARTPAVNPGGPTATKPPAIIIKPTNTPPVQPNPGNSGIGTPRP